MTESAQSLNLKPEDVSRLMRDPSAENRARIARKIGLGLTSAPLSEAERALAIDIVRQFARDAAARVRIALAESVKSTPHLPREIARQLAWDVLDVALPIVQFSQSLTDEDLIEIVRGSDPERQSAVASRELITPPVVDAVIEDGAENAVMALLANRSAPIPDAGLDRVLDRFGGRTAVPNAMARRESLPSRITERLVRLVSDSLRPNLIERFGIAPPLADQLIATTRERALKSLYAAHVTSTDPLLAAREMAVQRRLTPMIALRALCLGDVPFFEASLAVLANIALSNARLLIHDTGPLGLGSVLRKANVPKRLVPLFRVALAMAKELDFDLTRVDFHSRRRIIAERVLASFDDCREENIDSLLAKLDGLDALHNPPSDLDS